MMVTIEYAAGLAVLMFLCGLVVMRALGRIRAAIGNAVEARQQVSNPYADPDALDKIDLRTGERTRVVPITDPVCECGCRNFYEGPSGGMATNISCADCGTWYNIAPMLGIFEKLDKPKEKV